MTIDLMKELAKVVKACTYANGHAPLSDTELDLRLFIRKYHVTIQQNAESALRLMALEQAMERVSSQVTFHTLTNRSCIEQFLDTIRITADEFLREWKENGDE